MTDNSVIRHYKKELIHRQHDSPDLTEEEDGNNNNNINKEDRNGIYDYFDVEINKKERKTRKKRKNKNCRGQFRHEGIELIKLGTNTSHSLCKSKEPYNGVLNEKRSSDRRGPVIVMETNKTSVIQSTFSPEKTIILENPPKPAPYGHPSLPQMVPERRNSKEFVPAKIQTAAEPKLPSLPYIPPPDYRVPIHPLPYVSPYPFHYRPYPPPVRSPPPYSTLPRPIPQTPLQAMFPPLASPYAGIGFPFARHHPSAPAPPPVDAKRKVEERVRCAKRARTSPPVVAAIDLTVEGERQKCHHGDDPSRRKVKDEDAYAQVPAGYGKGKMVNGVLQLQSAKDRKQTVVLQQNGNVDKSKRVLGEHTKVENSSVKVPEGSPTKSAPDGTRLPQLFLIKDLLAKGVRVDGNNKRSPQRRSHGDQGGPRRNAKYAETTPLDLQQRRHSADVDTISVSSGESRTDTAEKQIPQGKLFYYRANNTLIRYFEDAQRRLFVDSLRAEGGGGGEENDDGREVIELPKGATFSAKDSLTVEEYVTEMTLAERYIPRDFFAFYKFVTGYQICNNNLPVSFLTFLKVYNTNGLKDLLERYVKGLKQAG